MKAVFDTKPSSVYDDDISRHYHFPRRYLAIVQQCVGDWVVLRRPRADGGNLAHFATARVVAVEADPQATSLSYARLADYLPFDTPVPWQIDNRYAEAPLRNMPQQQVGVYLRGRSVRPLAESDFAALVAWGLRDTLGHDSAERLGIGLEALQDAAADLLPPPEGERAHRIESILSNRLIREASFARGIYRAYEDRCAVTGLKITDRRGNSEVQAAHIWAVADRGPDVVQNGIALSATVHWLFDRHLLSLTDDYRIMVSPGRIPSELTALFAQSPAQIHLPKDPKLRPHPYYLAKHRNVFLAKESQ